MYLHQLRYDCYCRHGACEALNGLRRRGFLEVYIRGLEWDLDILTRISAAHSVTKVVFLAATASEEQLVSAIACAVG